ncbi:MAG: energy transducer TonB [Bacteroidaceae bacterium]|nr:energy transducer TonB [Bacteroidaceae bacterium]MBO4841258.1 energy transducer TonB [Bacteroidaceae bacterium]
MKNFIIVISVAMMIIDAIVCDAQTLHGIIIEEQQIDIIQEPVYEQDKVEQKTEFTGGMKKQIEFLMHNMKYPDDAAKEGVSGTVRVYFIVEKDGSLTDIKVPESVHPALDAEGLRIVKAMPKWSPAKLNGKAVRSKMMLSIPFRLK